SIFPNTGTVRLEHPLDFDKSPGVSVGRNPALVYNSATVHVRPIVEAQVYLPPFPAFAPNVPNYLEVTLNWGTNTTNPVQVKEYIVPGGVGFTDDPLQFAVQLDKDHPVTATGNYTWTLTVVPYYADVQ